MNSDSESCNSGSKEFFQQKNKNNLSSNSNLTSVDNTNKIKNKNDSNNFHNNFLREKFIKDLGYDLQDDCISKGVVVELNVSHSCNIKGKDNTSYNKDNFCNLPQSHTASSDAFLNKLVDFNVATSEKEKTKEKSSKLFEQDYIKFHTSEEKLKHSNNSLEEKSNGLKNSDVNTEKFHQSNISQIENINAIPCNEFFPWISEKTKNSRGMLKLHYEILDFYEFIKPTSEEDKLRDITVRRLKELIKQEFPDWTVKTFGSFPSRIHLPDSDVDIVVLPPKDKDKESSENQLRILKKILNKLVVEKCVDYIKLIDAKVPIIRATLKETKINIDISANGKNGYEAKKVIKKILEDFPCIRPILYVLKYFLRQRKLNESYTGGISSFLLFNLVLSYLQYVLKNEKTNGHSQTSEEKTLSLGDLLVGFFQFFAFDFNFEEVGISVKYGGYFYKKSERGW